MKHLLKIIFLLSLFINIYFIFIKITLYKAKQNFTVPFLIKDVSKKDGVDFLMNRIRKENPKLLPKKYYLINIWDIMCAPCIKEIPILDSLAYNIQRKDIGYIFLTENGNKIIFDLIKRKKIKVDNFVFMNDANDYISSVLKEKNVKNKSYPIQLIINKNGEIKYFDGGVIKTSNDTTLINIINKLP